MCSGDPALYYCRSFDVGGRLPDRLALINTDDKPGTAGLAGGSEKKILSSSFCTPKWSACQLLSHYQSSEPFLSPVRPLDVLLVDDTISWKCFTGNL